MLNHYISPNLVLVAEMPFGKTLFWVRSLPRNGTFTMLPMPPMATTWVTGGTLSFKQQELIINGITQLAWGKKNWILIKHEHFQ